LVVFYYKDPKKRFRRFIWKEVKEDEGSCCFKHDKNRRKKNNKKNENKATNEKNRTKEKKAPKHFFSWVF
jgi:hypothetical protein